jgi:Tfp pilus assembly protein PilV
MNSLTRTGRQRGVSLIEALVALAVMAFGMLGVVGMQTSLRGNADLSRQRAEAVRIAQEEVERLRTYSVLQASDAASGQLAFENIAAATEPTVAASDANTTFSRETLVAAPAASDPLIRHVRVQVAWTDRRAQDQLVELSTLIGGVPPEVAALHAMQADQSPLRQPYGRHASIPPGAVVDPGGVTSRFAPPGSPDVRWVFNNATGLITQICSVSTGTCTTGNRWLLSGIVAFATGDEPTSLEAEVPSDPAVSLTMSVDRTRPGYLPGGTSTTADVACATETVGTTRIRYYCAMPTTTIDVAAPGQRVWSGRLRFGGLPLAPTLADATSTNYKVCRYTPDERQFLDAGQVTAAGESLAFYNSRNPYSFLRVSSPQLNKNFLVISAGDGTTAFGCPDENTSTPIQSNTWPHEPIS